MLSATILHVAIAVNAKDTKSLDSAHIFLMAMTRIFFLSA